jgi:hypothetical protein
MLTDSELAAMREAIQSLFPDTCNICTVTTSPDGEGGWTESRGTSGTAIPCRLDAVQGYLQVTGGAIQPYLSYRLSLPYDASVDYGNIIEHSEIDYAIKSINLNQSWNAVIRIELEKI